MSEIDKATAQITMDSKLQQEREVNGVPPFTEVRGSTAANNGWCPKCMRRSTPLWPVSVVRPGDNADNCGKAWRVGCEACDITWIAQR